MCQKQDQINLLVVNKIHFNNNKATSVAQPSDTVIVHEGTYREEIKILILD